MSQWECVEWVKSAAASLHEESSFALAHFNRITGRLCSGSASSFSLCLSSRQPSHAPHQPAERQQLGGPCARDYDKFTHTMQIQYKYRKNSRHVMIFRTNKSNAFLIMRTGHIVPVQLSSKRAEQRRALHLTYSCAVLSP